MENTLSNDPASPSASATPAWFEAMVAPASAAPEQEPPAPIPDDSGGPEPAVTTDPATAQPVAAEPETPSDPAPPEPDRVSQLEAELNQIRQEREQEARQRQQAEFEAQRVASEEEYWTEVDRQAASIEDVEQKAEYYRKAGMQFAEQNAQFIRQQSEAAQFQTALRNFPSFARQNHGITAEQEARLTAFASDPNPQVAALKIATALEVFMEANATNRPVISPETTRDAVEQSLAQRANAEAAQNGVAALGGINSANPSPPTNPTPTSIRPGSQESFDLLRLGLSQV